MSSVFEKLFPEEYLPEKHQKTLDNARIKLLDYVLVVIPLLLLTIAIDFFSLEKTLNLIKIMPSVIIGFAIHAWLPLRFRLPFLCFITVITIFLLLELRDTYNLVTYFEGLTNGFSLKSISNSVFLLLIGCGLIALSHIPVKVKYRIWLVFIATLLLAFLRINLGIIIEALTKKEASASLISFLQSIYSVQYDIKEFTGANIILPILGAIFMFRLILYLYELQYEKGETNWWKRITYFFMLPNLVFPIFPIVDWKTYKRQYFNRPAKDIYLKGIWWMSKGFLHMFMYRMIYYYIIDTPTNVLTIYELLIYCAAFYALIIRISGLMHFAMGIMALFGFDLPETFNNYFLSNSFSDLWRRVNIYWKDFMMKVFYYPIYFIFKKLGANVAMVITIILVFAINWFLHEYQKFWIGGVFEIKKSDLIFWMGFGVLIAINSVYQANTSKKRNEKTVFSIQNAAFMTLRIMGMLLFMSFLWSFWTSSSIKEWVDLMKKLRYTTVLQIMTLVGGGIIILLSGILLHYIGYLQNTKKLPQLKEMKPRIALSYVILILFVCFGFKAVHEPISDALGFDPAPILETKMNKRDKEIQYRGYYEDMFAANNPFSQVGEAERKKPDDWKQLGSTGIVGQMKNVEYKRMKPNMDVMFKRARLTSNSHGLRDYEYALEKPEGTLRIALLGGSIEMGSGVRDHETFENVFEKLANRYDIFEEFDNVEVLNFSISGIHLPQHVYYLENKALQFDPDVVIYTAHPEEETRIINNMQMLKRKDLDLKYAKLQELFNKSGLQPGQSEQEFQDKLGPYKREITTWGYERIVKVCSQNNIVPVWAYIPVLEEIVAINEYDELSQLATELGFIVADFGNAYEGQKWEDLHLAIWDKHPNWEGHQFLGEEMFDVLKDNQELHQSIEARMDSISTF